MGRRVIVPFLLVSALPWFASACTDRLPDQDLRILQAVPAAKLSTDLLVKDYQVDKRAADRKYRGEAIEITGKISSLVQTPPRVLFVQPLQQQPVVSIQANLLDERAKGVLFEAVVGQRLTLRCFCEGLATDVILKSCIKP